MKKFLLFLFTGLLLFFGNSNKLVAQSTFDQFVQSNVWQQPARVATTQSSYVPNVTVHYSTPREYKSKPLPERRVIYENTNGIQNLSPSSEVVQRGNTTYIYNYSNGIRDIAPSQSITPNSYGGYSVYTHTNGIRNISPNYTIR